MVRSWGREHLVWDVIKTADLCKVTPSELNDRAVLRYGKPFRELSDDQLHDELQTLRRLLDSLDSPACNEPFQDPQTDERTETERQWDSEVL